MNRRSDLLCRTVSLLLQSLQLVQSPKFRVVVFPAVFFHVAFSPPVRKLDAHQQHCSIYFRPLLAALCVVEHFPSIVIQAQFVLIVDEGIRSLFRTEIQFETRYVSIYIRLCLSNHLSIYPSIYITF